MVRQLLPLVALLVGALPLSAVTNVTVNWKASDDNGLGLANGTPLPNGNEVRIGVFDFAGDISAGIQGYVNAGDFTGLAARFTTFDTAFIGTSAGANLGTIPLQNRAGLFEKSSGAVAVPTGSLLFGRRIFLWAFATTNNGAAAGDFSNVVQMGFFSSDTASWIFPTDTDNGIPASLSLELTNLSNTAGDALLGTAQIPLGSFGSSSVALATGDTHVFRLAAVVVPEPGSALLLAVGMVSFVGWRRRS